MKNKFDIFSNSLVMIIILISVVTEHKSGLILDVVTLSGIIMGLTLGIFCKEFKSRLVSLFAMFVLALSCAIGVSAASSTDVIGGGALKLLFCVSSFFAPGYGLLVLLLYISMALFLMVITSFFPTIADWSILNILYHAKDMVASSTIIFLATIPIIFFKNKNEAKGRSLLGTGKKENER